MWRACLGFNAEKEKHGWEAREILTFVAHWTSPNPSKLSTKWHDEASNGATGHERGQRMNE